MWAEVIALEVRNWHLGLLLVLRKRISSLVQKECLKLTRSLMYCWKGSSQFSMLASRMPITWAFHAKLNRPHCKNRFCRGLGSSKTLRISACQDSETVDMSWLHQLGHSMLGRVSTYSPMELSKVKPTTPLEEDSVPVKLAAEISDQNHNLWKKWKKYIDSKCLFPKRCKFSKCLPY